MLTTHLFLEKKVNILHQYSLTTGFLCCFLLFVCFLFCIVKARTAFVYYFCHHRLELKKKRGEKDSQQMSVLLNIGRFKTHSRVHTQSRTTERKNLLLDNYLNSDDNYTNDTTRYLMSKHSKQLNKQAA